MSKTTTEYGTGANRSRSKRILSFFAIIAILPIWLSGAGLIHMFSLPFSKTNYFNFNPDPLIGAIVASLSFPLLTSLVLYCSKMARSTGKFGDISITGAAFLFIGIATSIFPNPYLVSTIPFYLSSLVLFVVADLLLSISNKNFRYIAGAIFGSISFIIYFPLITHTYNEIYMNKDVWPNLTWHIYFEMIDKIYPTIIIPSVLAGMAGIMIGTRIINKFDNR
jgi:hypothetical protein